MIKLYKSKLLALLMLLSCMIAAHAQTPVQKYGQLKIFNGKVSDQNGNPVVLRGMSLFWSGYPEGSPFYNANTIKWLRDDWCVDVVRAAMSVETGNTNYINNQATEMNKIKTVIQACIDNGLYVIVDFHTHNAENYKTQAKAFFTEIATQYGHLPNVLYEPFNEPINQDWSSVIKPYHNELVSTIRAIDPDNIIICGTKNFSQDVDIAANDPVTGTNIAYTLHYYANSHQNSLRQKTTNALNRGAAIFVTEYGTCNASGNGGYNAHESQVWWDYLEANKISSCNWSIGNKAETSAALASGLNKQSNWSTGELTQSGNLVRNYIKSKCNLNVVTGSITLSFTGNKTQFNVGESITITAATTVSNNGSIAKVEFYSGTTLLGTDNTPSSFTYTTTTLPAGGHNITAKSFDAGNNLIATSPVYVITVVGASNVSTTGVTDQFETTEQFSELTGGVNGNSCATATAAAAVGVYWFEDRDAATPFKAEATRAGDGTLKYLLSQPANSYNVIGFNFGEYCEGGVKKKYTLDLSQNATLRLTVSAPSTNTASLDLKFQMKDADGTVLAFNKTVLTTGGTITTEWYRHEIGYSKNHSAPDFVSLSPGMTSNFIFDFKNAVSIRNPNSPSFPDDINTNNADFDYSKVVEIVIIPVNSADSGPTGNPAYAPLAYTNQQVIFSGLTLGDPSLGTNICTTPPAVTAASRTYCQNATTATALSATGVSGLELRWYTSSTGGVASTDAPIPSTSVPGVSSYYVSQGVTGSTTCESSRAQVDVTIVEAPTSNAGNDLTAIQGPSVELNATGSATGTWSVVSAPTGATVTFSPSANAASVTAEGMVIKGDYKFRYTVPGTSPCTAAASDININVTFITASLDALTESNVEIYPNPVSDNLHINLSKVKGQKSIKIVDMLGKVVFETTNGDAVDIEMSDLTKGMYFIHIQAESGNMVKSVIKK